MRDRCEGYDSLFADVVAAGLEHDFADPGDAVRTDIIAVSKNGTLIAKYVQSLEDYSFRRLSE